MLKGIGHIAILSSNLDETVAIYQKLLGASPGEALTLPEMGVKVAVLDVGGETELEVIEPLPGSRLEKVLEERGEGIHHICLDVDDIERELDSLADKGVNLIDRKARRGVMGMVAFIHPKSTKGVLVELCQRD